MNNLNSSSERVLFRPEPYYFPTLPAWTVLHERFPQYSCIGLRELQEICRQVGVSHPKLMWLLEGKEKEGEQEQSKEISESFGVPRERLFPPDYYPWLYCDDYFPDCPASHIRAKGDILPESEEDVEDTTAMRRIEAGEKLAVGKNWTRAYERLQEANGQEIGDAQDTYEQACLELLGIIIADHPVEGIDIEDIWQECRCNLLEAVCEYKQKPPAHLNMVTFVRNKVQEPLEDMAKQRERTLHLSARSIERDTMVIPDVAEEHPLALAFSDEYTSDARLQNIVTGVTEETEAEDNVMAKMLRQRIAKVLRTISPREGEVLRLRYGLEDSPEHTLEEVGAKLSGIGKENVRQVEARAIRQLQQPSRACGLQDFLPAKAPPAVEVESDYVPLRFIEHYSAPMIGYVQSFGAQHIHALMWFENHPHKEGRVVSIPRELFPHGGDFKSGAAIRWTGDHRIQFISVEKVLFPSDDSQNANEESEL